MPPVRSLNKFLPEAQAEPMLKETLIRAAARKRAAATALFHSELGETPEEVEQELAKIRGDINRYGEYVYGFKATNFHEYWNQAIDDVIYRRVPQNKILLIAPPNSAKSTWASVIRATHYLGNHPDEHIITVTSSDPNAKDFDSVWTRTVEDSEKFKALFPGPDVKPYKKMGWSSDGRYLRGIPEGDRHPTFRSVGLNGSVMGARANVILDDPMDQKTAQSEAEQRKAKNYLDQTLIPRLQPDVGWMIAVMTRYAEQDLGGHLVRLAKESGDWLYIRTPMVAELDDPLGRKPGELLWPERLNAAYVANERRRLTTGEFNMIHQGDPSGIGGDVFKSESWFQDLPENFWKDIFKTCKILVVSDTAFSEKKSACFSVIMTIAIDPQFNMYILHCFRDRLTMPKLENVFVSIIQLSKPIIVGIEEDNFHKHLTRQMARNIMSRRMCNMRLIQPDKDKRSRALLPAARAENGRLFVDKRYDWYPILIKECLGFPRSGYADQVDTLSLGAHVANLLEEYMQTDINGNRPLESIEIVA